MSVQAPSFINGWRTLPEELKLHILSLVVAPERSKRGLLSYHHIDEARYWNQHPFRGVFASLLSFPEIKPLVFEAFYTQNSFFLDYSSTDYDIVHGNAYMYLPSRRVQKFVRRINIRFSLLSRERLELLEKIASGTSRLENLVSLDIHLPTPVRTWFSAIDYDDCILARKFRNYLRCIDDIWFESKCLRITYEHYPTYTSVDKYETWLLDKLTLHPLMGPRETTWTRFIGVHDESGAQERIQEVDSWSTANTIRHNTRWTVKEIVTRKEHRLKPYTRLDQIW